MVEPDYVLRKLTLEEEDAIKTEIEAVLDRHNAEIQVTSTLLVLKREIPSPYANGEETEEKPNSETEKGS